MDTKDNMPEYKLRHATGYYDTPDWFEQVAKWEAWLLGELDIVNPYSIERLTDVMMEKIPVEEREALMVASLTIQDRLENIGA